MNLNKVLIAGRLTKQPEVRTTPAGQSVATFSVATSRSWKDKNQQKQEKSSFHNCVAWGKLADIIGQYLVKGQEIYVEGRIETRDYTDKQGNKRYVTEIIVDQMQMGNKPKGYDASATTQTAPPEEIPTINLDEDPDEVRLEDVPF
jgi:single-strand DNA-binding protein